ncbi:MAG TPA: head-tail adaptor protein [Bacteroidales bacterium]|nr:head-tail adaptor protein [Bacteroidales bacterium]
MKDIQIIRKSQTYDGMGGFTETTTATTVVGVIYQSGTGGRKYLSDKMVQETTHVLVMKPSSYTFTSNDVQVTHGGKTYTIIGIPDDVMGYGEITVVGLRQAI